MRRAKKYCLLGGYAFRVSRKFYEVELSEDSRRFVGTPSDIRKVCHILDFMGYYPAFANKPIMREGRIYSVSYDDWYVDPMYAIHRVQEVK